MKSLALITLCVLVLIMVSGCLMFYTGSEEGPFEVVAIRNEPGRSQEAILQSECRANWEVVFGPDGGGPTYFKGIRYYIASGGRTNELSYATRWAYNLDEICGPIAVRGTDRWVLVYEDDKTPDLVTLDVRLFTAQKLIDKFEIKEVLRGPCTGPLRLDMAALPFDCSIRRRRPFSRLTTDSSSEDAIACPIRMGCSCLARNRGGKILASVARG